MKTNTSPSGGICPHDLEMFGRARAIWFRMYVITILRDLSESNWVVECTEVQPYARLVSPSRTSNVQDCNLTDAGESN